MVIPGYYAPSGAGWRLANSLQVLAAEIGQAFPDATCLGTVGDSEHSAQYMDSDHNPFVLDPKTGMGIVRAIDFGGPDLTLMQIRQRLWQLYAEQDPRLFQFGYAKGCSDNLINNWGLPFGLHEDDGDAGHLHVSVTQVNGFNPSPGGYVAAIDSTAPWGFVASAHSSSDSEQEEDDDMLQPFAIYHVQSPGTPQQASWIVALDWAHKIRIQDLDQDRVCASLANPATPGGPWYKTQAITDLQLANIPELKVAA